MLRLLSFVVGLMALAETAEAGQVYGEFPAAPDPSRAYVIYAHGLIVEGTDPRPVHPRWGVYDFPAVAEAFVQPDTDVIAIHRPKGTDPGEHAAFLAENIRRMVANGVEQRRITLIGFSRGGYIVALTSNALRDAPVNTVILAGCAGWVEAQQAIQLSGHVLSVFETSDFVGSCLALADRSAAILSFREIAIDTGKEHGAFYRPRKAWVSPTKAWIGRMAEADGP